jgi:diketogulonate reductase-like aldo/keto reductase
MEQIPKFGFGTYCVKGPQIREVLEHVLNSGYAMIDTASLYRNEKMIGEMLEELKVDRTKIWITTKVQYFAIKDKETTKCVMKSMQDLKVKYLDLVLLHAPDTDENNLIAYKELLVLQKKGLIKYIGVSNYKENHLKHIMDETKTVPYTNQIEVTPFCTRTSLVKYCRDNNIIITAHTPLVKAKKFDNEILQKIAKKYSVSAAQVLIKWSMQKNYIVIPRSVNKEHITENISHDFVISDTDMDILDKLNENFVTHEKYL